MTSRHTARMLTRYNAWADDLIFGAVAKLPADEATKPRATLFKNIVHTLNHIHVIDLIFQAHLQARGHGFSARNTADHPPLDHLQQSQQQLDSWFIKWSDDITEASLAEQVTFSFVGGGHGKMTREQMLLHVVNHTSYHRGYIADLFYQIPARVPTTDLTVFLRDVPQV